MQQLETSAPAMRCMPLTAWPSLLSLDAVFVALAWQQLLLWSFCRRASTWAEMGSLAATVWLIYVADRLLDASRLKLNQPHTLRHRFYRRHARLFMVLWIVVLVSDTIIVVRYLPAELLRSGLLLASAILVYGVHVHISYHFPAAPPSTQIRQRDCFAIPKEIRVGTLFACGVSLTTWTQLHANGPVISPSLEGPIWTLAAATCAMAILFSCNCILVARFERELDHAQAFTSIANQAPWAAGWVAISGIRVLSAIIMLLFLPLLLQLPRLIFIAVVLSGLALGLSIMFPNRPKVLSTLPHPQTAFDIRSVWVDAALWTPPMVLLCLS